MKKFLYFLLIILLSFSILFPEKCFAEKKKKKNSVITLPAIDAVNNDGEKTIFGSVLDPNENQVLFLLPKPLLNAIRKLGLKNLSINVTSALDSTKTYLVPPNGISVQLRRVQGKVGRYLVTNISSLTTPSGITVSPSALPSDEYKLKVTEETLDITTNKFNYRTPILLVGTIKSGKIGFVTVEDLNGNEISDKTVAISPNGTFITEVRANKLQSEKKEARKRLNRAQVDTGTGESAGEGHGDLASGEGNGASTTGEGASEKIDVGVVHAVTDKDLFAVVPLDNNVETNAAIADKPIEIDDSSTLTANLGKEYEVIANEVAKEELGQLESEEEITKGFEDFECDIYKFADRCKIASDEELGSIGSDFREFTQTTSCAFPEYELIKSLIAASPEEANLLIGKGYCEFTAKATEVNEDKPCLAYNDILLDFKQGLLSQLPCPPLFCKQFKNIKPPKCFEPIDFCEEEEPLARATQGPSCIRRPIKDLYCAKIGVDVTEEKCVGITNQGITPEGASVFVTWVAKLSTDGNNYCVPQQIQVTNLSTGVTNIFPEDPSLRAEGCKTVNCHKLCEQGVKKELPPDLLPAISFTPNGQVCEVCNCHLACDAEAGRIVDCGNPKSIFFASSCCNQRVVNTSFTTQHELKGQFFGGGGFGGFTPKSGPAFPPPLVRECICQSISNFNEKGFVTQEAIDRCKNNCPQGFEIDKNGEFCVQVCPKGSVVGPNGACIRKCPPGFIEDDFGSCKCPEGQFVGRSGNCEQASCPDFCKNISFGPGFTPSGTQPGGNLPPECQGCFGGLGVCPSGQKKDPVTGKCVSSCGQDQYSDQNGVCRCNADGSIASSTGPEGCKKQTCSSNMLPNPKANEPNQAACVCPQGLPYWDGAKCVAQCPGGNPPPSTIASLPLNSPVPCSNTQRYCGIADIPSRDNCTCAPGATSPAGTTACVCTAPGQTYTPTGCSSSSNYCAPAISTTTGCTCGPGATPSGANSTCQCPNNTPAYTAAGCGGTSTRPCNQGEGPSNNCYCFGGGFTGTDGRCQCSRGVIYTGAGCGTTTSNYCSPGIVPTAANPCTCGPGGVFNSQNICSCTNGQAYTLAGCGTTTSNYCSPAIVPTATNPCTCNPSGGSFFSSSNTCTCPSGSGQTYTAATGCSNTASTNYCAPAVTAGTGNPPCTCAPGATATGINNSCQCPNNTPAYTPAGCGGTSTRPCNQGEGPSNNCYCFGGGFTGTDGKCQCSGGVTYTGAGCGTNYCPPAIVPTATNPCTCNPSGGSFFSSSNTCTCPSGSGQTYTAATGCSNTASTNYCAPAVTAGTGNPPCTCAPGATATGINNSCQCPNNTPAYTAAGCGTTTNYCSPGITIGTNGCTCNPAGGAYNSTGYCTCPSGSSSPYTKETGCTGSTTRPCTAGEGPSNGCYCFGGGFNGTDGKCQCPNNNNPPYTGGGCSTTNYCAPAVTAGTGNPPCTCAPGATPSGANSTCQCTNGQGYTAAGCGTTTNYCAPAISTTTGCTCAPGATPSGANSTCQCTTAGQTYSSAGCGTTTTYCGVGIAPQTGNCTCAPGATSPTGTTACTCATGQTYSATGCVSNPTITLSSVTISGSNVTISYSTDSYACLLVKDTSNNAIKSANFCGTGSFNSVFPTADFTPALVSGTQVKLCNQANSTNCSNLVAVIASAPSSPSALTAILSSGNINLTWIDNSSDETEFKISRRPSGGAWTQIATVGTNITSYTDTNPAAGTYDYHVNACNTSGCSSDSNIVTITK